MLNPDTLAAINEFVETRGLPFTDYDVLVGIAEGAAASQNQALSLQIPADWPVDYFQQFYKRYPNKKAPERARKALDKVAFAGKTKWGDLIAGLERYIISRDVQRGFVQHPATWLNGGCWKDEEQSRAVPVERPASFFEVATGKSW